MISIDHHSAVPPFEQIRAQFATLILAGELPPGTRLPTVRALATELGLAVNTVARSLRELEHAGLVVTRGRAGTIVGAGGHAQRERARLAAHDYAELVRSLGLDSEEAVGFVRAALADRAR